MKRFNKHALSVPKAAKQLGFTLVELLVGITILLAFSSILIFSFDGDRTKTALILESARQYGDGFLRYKSDTGVTPIAMHSLYQRGENLAADIVEGTAATNVWRGPYVNAFPANAAGNVRLDSVAPGAILSIAAVPAASLPAGSTAGTEFQFSGIPSSVAREAIATCNGVAVSATVPANFTAGNKCASTATTVPTPTATVRYLVSFK